MIALAGDGANRPLYLNPCFYPLSCFLALFEFELTPADAVTPWGPPSAPELHWYALTDGRFWMQIDSRLPLGGGLSFYVAQLWESLVDIDRRESSALNLRFLDDAPEVSFTWVKDAVLITWSGGACEIPVVRFRREMRDFHERFFAAMAERASVGGPRFADDHAMRYLWLK